MHLLIKIGLKNLYVYICDTFKPIDVNDNRESVMDQQVNKNNALPMSTTTSACSRGDRRSNLGDLATQVLLCSTKFLLLLIDLQKQLLSLQICASLIRYVQT